MPKRGRMAVRPQEDYMSQSNLSGPLAITDALIVGGTIGAAAITSSALLSAANIHSAGTINSEGLLSGANIHTAGTIGGGDITGTGLIASGGTITVGTQHWTYAASAPAAGVWNAGDVVFTTAPAAGEPVGWSCTVGGEPGTWLGFGTL